MKPTSRTKAPKTAGAYRQLWRVVDGAVKDALTMHPEFLASVRHEKNVRTSINKRVVGAVLSYAKQRGAA